MRIFFGVRYMIEYTILEYITQLCWKGSLRWMAQKLNFLDGSIALQSDGSLRGDLAIVAILL